MKKILMIMIILVVSLFAEEKSEDNFVLFLETQVLVEKESSFDDGFTFYNIDHSKYFDTKDEYIACILTSKGSNLENLLCTSVLGGKSYSGKVQGVILKKGVAYIGVPLVKMNLIKQIN